MGRITASRKQLKGDPRHDSLLVSKFINCLMYDGKKTIAQAVFYDALDVIKKKITLSFSIVDALQFPATVKQGYPADNANPATSILNRSVYKNAAHGIGSRPPPTDKN